MFEGLIEHFELGQEIEAHGETWICVKSFRDNLYLAVRPKSRMPAPLFLVKGKLKIEDEKKADNPPRGSKNETV